MTPPAPFVSNESEDDLAWPDALACERVVVRFTAAFDAADLNGMLREFMPDGSWQRQDGTIRGHDGLRAMMAARLPSLLVRHVISNLIVTRDGPDRAVCLSYVTVYRHDGDSFRPAPLGQPSLVGRYHDRLCWTAGKWLLAYRSVIVDLKQI